MHNGGAEGGYVGPGEGAGSYLLGTQREWQAQCVPCAVLVERAVSERHVGEVAVGTADGRAIVGVVSQTDGGGRHVVGAIV